MVLDIVSSTPTVPAKTRIRATTHEGTDTKVVRYAALHPLVSPRPVHMHAATDAETVTPGRFVVFTKAGSTEVKGGLVHTVHDVTVHEHTQGASQHRRFTPVYRNTRAATIVLGICIGISYEPPD